MKYTEPEMEIVLFKTKDLVRTSPLDPDGIEDEDDTTSNDNWGD